MTSTSSLKRQSIGEKTLQAIRNGEDVSSQSQLKMILSLSWPTILAQLSTTLMQLIDASMAGRLGANASAAIGLVASSTWMVNGLSSGAVFGFSVQTSQAIGAKEMDKARSLCRQGWAVVMIMACLMMSIGLSVSQNLPAWLGADPEIVADSTAYFGLYCLSLPFVLLNSWAVQMLQATGNTRIPGFCQIAMCVLDVFFNAIFIFALKLGVAGAAIGTMCAVACSSLFLTFFVLKKSPLQGRLKFSFQKTALFRALKIGLPISVEQFISTSAYVLFTKIVAVLGSYAVAANSFAITAESLCYMPGYGVASAGTAVIGQCMGAGRKDLAYRLAWKTTWIGTLLMSFSGLIMFVFAPELMMLLTPIEEIQAMGTICLRVEAFAEPMYGASIVVTGVLRGKGDTLGPTILNFLSMWCVRIPLAILLRNLWGLSGIWIAMMIELNFRGLIFLIWMKFRWNRKPHIHTA